MSKDYIKCDCCGKKIFFGDVVYFYHGYCGIYCSAECYADNWGESTELYEKLAEDNGCKIYNEEQRRKELIKEIDKLAQQLDKARAELDNL